PPQRSTLFPYTTLFRSKNLVISAGAENTRIWGTTSTGRRAAPSNVRSGPGGARSIASGLGAGDACTFPASESFSRPAALTAIFRSEEHTSELQSLAYLV